MRSPMPGSQASFLPIMTCSCPYRLVHKFNGRDSELPESLALDPQDGLESPLLASHTQTKMKHTRLE